MPRSARVQPIVLFSVCAVLVLGALVYLSFFTKSRPSNSTTPSTVGTSGQSTTSGAGQAHSGGAALGFSPVAATELAIACSDRREGEQFRLSLNSQQRWTIAQSRIGDEPRSESPWLAQDGAVRGALSLLRDALQTPGASMSTENIGVNAGWTEVLLRNGTSEMKLLIEGQSLGGKTRVVRVEQGANTGIVHTGPADLAAIFRFAAVASWHDASAMPNFGGRLQEVTFKHKQQIVRLSKRSEGRWMMVEPVSTLVDGAAVEQVLNVLRSVQLQNAEVIDVRSRQHAEAEFAMRSATAQEIMRAPVLRVEMQSTTESDTKRVDVMKQTLYVGSVATAGTTTRHAVSHAELEIDPSVSLRPPPMTAVLGTLETKGLFEFVQSPEALLPKLALRGGVADVGSLHVRFESELLKNVNVIAPAERTDKGLLLVRATNTQRAELKAEWVSPAAAEPLQLNAATKTQQELASAIGELLGKVEPESLLLLRDANSLAKVFDIGTDKEQPAGSIGASANTNRQRVRGAASLTVRDLGGAANLTGAFGLSTSGDPRVLLRVGHVLRVWNAKKGAAKRVHELLLQEVPPEG